MPHVRPASVAGRWYPGDRVSLASEVDEYVARAGLEPVADRVQAIVAPHAGLTYSGPVAAFAYSAVRGIEYSAIVLVGPSHFVAFDGVSIWPEGSWDTPFGPIDVDRDLAASLRLDSSDIIDFADAHAREHSLEMQLPFIARLMPGTPIVPLLMGYQNRRTAFSLGDALARVAGRHASSGRHVLLVASSDLSHFEDARTAQTMDAAVIDRVERFDSGGLMDAIEREPRHACGGGPMVAVLRAASLLGATQARVLHYADSGDVSGDKSSVVGYMAAAVW